MNDEKREQSLATERDIDPEFGMFAEELESYSVPDAEDKLTAMLPDRENLMSAEGDGVFPDIPDADAVSGESPVDPASPAEQFHGTDLLNGVGLHPEEETEDSGL